VPRKSASNCAMAVSKASAVTGGIGTSVLPELTKKGILTMPF
jgi:hypothetical protein